ncbi:MAG: hypothetical protein MPJ50_15475 [Pirellulales bacterium]|nr:hypothetical protein [Pirellulales bacterium]
MQTILGFLVCVSAVTAVAGVTWAIRQRSGRGCHKLAIGYAVACGLLGLGATFSALSHADNPTRHTAKLMARPVTVADTLELPAAQESTRLPRSNMPDAGMTRQSALAAEQLAPIKLEATTQTEETTKQTANRAKWLAMLPHIHAYREAVAESAADSAVRVVEAADQIKVPQGIERFIEELLDLESEIWSIVEPDEHRAWVTRRFRNQAIDLEQFHDTLRTEGAELERMLIALDNELLVALEIDSEFDPSMMEIKPIDFSKIRQQLERLEPAVVAAAEQATQEALVTLGAGLAADYFAGQAAASMLSDDGETSLADFFASMLIGGVADEITTLALEEALETKTSLRVALHRISNDLVNACVPDVTVSGGWTAEFCRLARTHHETLTAHLIEHMGVDRDWAYAQLRTTQFSQ